MDAVHGPAETRLSGLTELLDRLGAQLYRFAGILTDDADLAGQLIVTAIAEHSVDGAPHRDLRMLSGAVYLDWGSRNSAARESSAFSGLRDELCGLPYEQFAAIVLCSYGAHSYRQAADLLGVSAAELALSLCSALRSLGGPTVGRTVPTFGA